MATRMNPRSFENPSGERSRILHIARAMDRMPVSENDAHTLVRLFRQTEGVGTMHRPVPDVGGSAARHDKTNRQGVRVCRWRPFTWRVT